MIAIATGLDELNEILAAHLKDTEVVLYREYLTKNEYDTVILSERLPGTIEVEQLIFSLRQNNTRIIFLTEQDAADEIKMCLKYSIYDMVFDPISAPKIIDIINNPRTFADINKLFVQHINNEIIEEEKKTNLKDLITGKGKTTETDGEVKTEVIEKEVIKEVIRPVPVYVERTIKQQILAFYTTDNSLDKDDVLAQIAILLAQKTKQSILVIDMNTITPTLDHFFGVDKEILLKDLYRIGGINTGLAAVYNAIEKDIFAADLLEEMVIKHKNANLHILTGLYDMNMFETVEKEHFETLIKTAADIYDTIILNTHPDIAVTSTYVSLMNATSIIAVTGANYTYARNTNSIIKYLNEYHRIPKKKFKIVVNNISNSSLSKDVMAKIFEDYEVLGYLPYNPKREACLNNQKPFITSQWAKKDVLNYLEVIEKLGYYPKVNVLDKLFKRKKIASEVCIDGDV